MSEISSWVLSIAGIICVSVLLELLIPEGQMNKYIKSIFSFVIILVIILPLPKIFNKEINSNSMFEYKEIALQSDYLYQINLSKLSAITKTIEDEIKNDGFDGVTLSVSADIFDEKMDYKGVFVNLRNLVITDESTHKNIVEIKEEISSIIKKYISYGEVIFEE